MEKTCRMCLKQKSLSHDFYIIRKTPSRVFYTPDCKQCTILKKKDYVNSKGYYHTPKFRLRARLKGRHKYGRRKHMLQAYTKKYPEKIKARAAVRRALTKGTLEKKPCLTCSSSKTQAHHHKGYDKQHRLTVKWYCDYHHKLIHRI